VGVWKTVLINATPTLAKNPAAWLLGPLLDDSYRWDIEADFKRFYSIDEPFEMDAARFVQFALKLATYHNDYNPSCFISRLRREYESTQGASKPTRELPRNKEPHKAPPVSYETITQTGGTARKVKLDKPSYLQERLKNMKGTQ